MGQKIVMTVAKMQCLKCRSEALQIAAGAPGVTYVGLEGDYWKEKIVVKGDGVDAVTLAAALKKKFGHACIISLGDDK